MKGMTVETMTVADIEHDLADALTLLGGDPAFAGARPWLEYQAFLEFVRFVIATDQLPDDFVLPQGFEVLGEEGYEDEAAAERLSALLQMARSRTGAMAVYRTQTEILFEKLHRMGSPLAERICALYCTHKARLDFANEAAAALFIAKGIVMDLWSGLPITTFIALLIKSGVLSRLCKCS